MPSETTTGLPLIVKVCSIFLDAGLLLAAGVDCAALPEFDLLFALPLAGAFAGGVLAVFCAIAPLMNAAEMARIKKRFIIFMANLCDF
jgi:hypothetical protein